MSLPEVLLWRNLRHLTLGGLKFRRQHPFGPYVLDFYCADARLAVEVDGQSHYAGDRPQRDERRDALLTANGVQVLRLSARLVLNDMDAALRTIQACARQPPSRPSAGLPPKGEDQSCSCNLARSDA